jgi:hypothetical protein
MILATTRIVASPGATGAGLVAPTETRLGGGELLRRARRKTLPLTAPSLAAGCGLETLSDEADEGTAAAGELLRRARRSALPSALPSPDASESLGLVALATGLELMLGAAPLRRARRDAARDVSSASPGIGMPLARAGTLGGVLLGPSALALLALALLALALLGRGAPRRDGAVWRSSIGSASSIGRASSRPLARGDKSASASESQSDGSGLPNSRLPERRCVPMAKAPSSGSGHSSILFMPGVLSTGGGSSHSEGGTRASATLTLAADGAQDKRTGEAPVSSRGTAEQAPSAGRPGGARFWGLSSSSRRPNPLEQARSERGRWM